MVWGGCAISLADFSPVGLGSVFSLTGSVLTVDPVLGLVCLGSASRSPGVSGSILSATPFPCWSASAQQGVPFPSIVPCLGCVPDVRSAQVPLQVGAELPGFIDI